MTPNPDSGRPKIAFTLILVAVWALLFAGLHWFFKGRHQQAFNEQWFSFSAVAELRMPADLRQTLQGTNPLPTLIHFSNPDCDCTRFSLAHIQRLKHQYGAQFVDHWVDPTPPQDPFLARLAALVPATPAAALFDAEGRLLYLGPYSSGARCGEGDDFIADLLQRLAAGAEIPWVTQEAIGCYCAWPLGQSPEPNATVAQ